MIDNFTDVTQLHLELIDTFNGKELEKLVSIHPFIELGYDYDVPLLNADFVTTEQGTGIVHVAPSHGPDDFALGLKNEIKAENTIDDKGYYTNIIKHFEG